MKKYLLLVLLCSLIVMSLGLNQSYAADKGRKFYEERGLVVWDIQTDEKIVAITFDDGPHRKHTHEVLEVLNKYDAKATFFIIGENAEKHPEIVLQIYEEGHELANHTFTHPYKTSVPRILEEIKKTNETIYSITGFTPTLFRPVEGYYTDAMINAIAKEGFKIVMWSWHQDTEDWKNPGVGKIVNRVLKGTKQGNVILFHDGGGNRKQTVEALDKIIPELQQQGYRFVTISELIEIQRSVKK